MKKRKRILAAVLTAVMMFSLLPVNAFAAETAGNDAAEAVVETVSVSGTEQEAGSTREEVLKETAEAEESSVPEEPEADEAPEESSVPEKTEEAAGPADEENVKSENQTGEEAEKGFETGSADAKAGSPKTLKAEGRDYVVTVTYYDSAFLPDDVKIETKEIRENARKYVDYCDDALEAVRKENDGAESIGYIRLFDISLVDGEGNKVQPDTAVDVQIRLKDVESVEDNTQIVHFAGEEEKPELIEPVVDLDTVTFETEGFSVYAVVTSGEYARLKVNFTESADKTTAMYVKQKDITDGNLSQVLYDPGVTVLSGRKFLGWTDDQNWTGLTVNQMKEKALTIDDVRSEVTQRLTEGVTDGTEVTYYAVMVNCFELYYQDENQNTFRTDNLLSATDSASSIVDCPYTLTGGTATQDFVGWKVKGTETPVYPNGTEITIRENTVLVPAVGEGRWVWFDSNAGGAGVSEASYTPRSSSLSMISRKCLPSLHVRVMILPDGMWDLRKGPETFLSTLR